MANNPILDDLHATRERLLAESGGTVSGLIERLRAEQAASIRPIFKAGDEDSMDRDSVAGDLPVEKLSSPPGDC